MGQVKASASNNKTKGIDVTISYLKLLIRMGVNKNTLPQSYSEIMLGLYEE